MFAHAMALVDFVDRRHRVVLRQFLYRDDDLIREFLAQVEGGVFETDDTKTTAARKRGLSGGASGGPLSVQGELARNVEQQSARTVRQTGASEFERLYNSLGEDDLQYLEVCDDDIWADLRRGEILELEVVAKPTGLQKIAELFGRFEELMPVLRAAGEDATLDPSALPVMQVIRQLGALGGVTAHAMIGALVGAPAFKVAFNLREEAMQADLEALGDEVTLLCKLSRKIRKDEQFLFGQIFGGLEEVLDADAQKDFGKMFDDPSVRMLGIESPLLTYPAAIVTPIALYR